MPNDMHKFLQCDIPEGIAGSGHDHYGSGYDHYGSGHGSGYDHYGSGYDHYGSGYDHSGSGYGSGSMDCDHHDSSNPCHHPAFTPEEKPICNQIVKRIEANKEPCDPKDPSFSRCQVVYAKGMALGDDGSGSGSGSGAEYEQKGEGPCQVFEGMMMSMCQREIDTCMRDSECMADLAGPDRRLRKRFLQSNLLGPGRRLRKSHSTFKSKQRRLRKRFLQSNRHGPDRR